MQLYGDKFMWQEKWKDVLSKVCPWGTFFAKRYNFESGYLLEEARLVTKYLKMPSYVLVKS